MNVIRYIHHGQDVAVWEDLKGRHREYCLCYQCEKFHPGEPVVNCPVAEALYRFDILAGVTTPVWECPDFKDAHAEAAEKKEEPAE